MSRSDASPDMGRPVRALKPTSALTPQSPQLKGRKTTHGRSAFRFFRRRISIETIGAFLPARIRRLHARRLEYLDHLRPEDQEPPESTAPVAHSQRHVRLRRFDTRGSQPRWRGCSLAARSADVLRAFCPPEILSITRSWRRRSFRHRAPYEPTSTRANVIVL